MRTDEITTLYAYNYWANRRILDAATLIVPEQFSAPAPFSHASL